MGIIAFILVVGGAFGVVLRTGAIESGIMRVIDLTNGKEILLIPILITLFSLGGAVFGMGEEAIPFVMILVPMFIAMGYDAIVGIMCSYVATQIGFGSSWQNPFGLAVAQGIARSSGYVRRMVSYPAVDLFYSPYNCIYHAVRGKDKEKSEIICSL